MASLTTVPVRHRRRTRKHTHLGVTGMFHSFTIGAAVAIVFTLIVGRTIQ